MGRKKGKGKRAEPLRDPEYNTRRHVNNSGPRELPYCKKRNTDIDFTVRRILEMVSRIHSSDARGICRVILPESWKCSPLRGKGTGSNRVGRQAAAKRCTTKNNFLSLLVRNSPKRGYGICGIGMNTPFFCVCWEIERVRFTLNSFCIQCNLETHKQQLL